MQRSQIIVRRCFYIDEVSGEEYPGIASNFLCDAKVGTEITLTGPYKNPFTIPPDNQSNLLMIGTGTGIAPFRAFAQNIYANQGDWKGQIKLYFGDHTGLDLQYLNDAKDDIANYYTQESFEAFQAISKRYPIDSTDALKQTLEARVDEMWALLQEGKTFVYMAGNRKNAQALDKVLSEKAGSEDAWQTMKSELQTENRWSELLYA